jgi:hypothetical protein
VESNQYYQPEDMILKIVTGLFAVAIVCLDISTTFFNSSAMAVRPTGSFIRSIPQA